MHKKRMYGIIIICGMTISMATVSAYFLMHNNSSQDQKNNLKLNFAPNDNITFSDLQNTTNFEVIGSDPSIYIGEYYQVQIIIHYPLFNTWTNSTKSLLKISNHDKEQRDVYFDATGGSKVIQWIYLNFSQHETNKNASIVWNDKNKINYYGDWSQKDNLYALSIPGKDGSTISSINFYFLAISFDKGTTKDKMEKTNWEVYIYSTENANANGFIFIEIFLTLEVVQFLKNKRKRQIK